MRKLGLVALVFLLAALLLPASPASAARDGSAGHTKAVANVAVYQAGALVESVASGTDLEVRGAGFRSGTTVYVGLQGYFGLSPVVTDGAGSFSLPQVAPAISGSYTYVVLAYKRNAWQVAASVTFSVL